MVTNVLSLSSKPTPLCSLYSGADGMLGYVRGHQRDTARLHAQEDPPLQVLTLQSLYSMWELRGQLGGVPATPPATSLVTASADQLWPHYLKVFCYPQATCPSSSHSFSEKD